MTRLFMLLAFAILLVGCKSLPKISESSNVLVKNQFSELTAFGANGLQVSSGDALDGYLTRKPETAVAKAISSFKTECQAAVGGPDKISPAAVPIIAAIGQLLYERGVDKRNAKLEALKKSATAGYSASLVFESSSNFIDYQCLILSRHEADKTPSAFTLWTISNSSGLTRLKAVGVYTRNTIANSKSKPKPPQVTLISGMAVQGIGKQQNGLPILATTGQDTKKIGKFGLNTDTIHNMSGKGVSLGPVPVFLNSSPLMLRLSMTETGDVGVDIDERIAANIALKEAVGPALSDAIKAHYDD